VLDTNKSIPRRKSEIHLSRPHSGQVPPPSPQGSAQLTVPHKTSRARPTLHKPPHPKSFRRKRRATQPHEIDAASNSLHRRTPHKHTLRPTNLAKLTQEHGQTVNFPHQELVEQRTSGTTDNTHKPRHVKRYATSQTRNLNLQRSDTSPRNTHPSMTMQDYQTTVQTPLHHPPTQPCSPPIGTTSGQCSLPMPLRTTKNKKNPVRTVSHATKRPNERHD